MRSLTLSVAIVLLSGATFGVENPLALVRACGPLSEDLVEKKEKN